MIDASKPPRPRKEGEAVFFVCSGCNAERLERREGKSLRCSDCRNASSRKYWASDKGFAEAKRRRAKRFGVTVEFLDDLYEKQNGLCACCGDPFRLPRGHKFPCVDHDHACCDWHATVQRPICGSCIRGLLCWACNVMMGSAFDDPKRLNRGADYLERHKRTDHAALQPMEVANRPAK